MNSLDNWPNLWCPSTVMKFVTMRMKSNTTNLPHTLMPTRKNLSCYPPPWQVRPCTSSHSPFAWLASLLRRSKNLGRICWRVINFFRRWRGSYSKRICPIKRNICHLEPDTSYAWCRWCAQLTKMVSKVGLCLGSRPMVRQRPTKMPKCRSCDGHRFFEIQVSYACLSCAL